MKRFEEFNIIYEDKESLEEQAINIFVETINSNTKSHNNYYLLFLNIKEWLNEDV